MIITAKTKKLAEFALSKFSEEGNAAAIFGRRIVIWRQEKCPRCGRMMIMPNWPVQIDGPRTTQWDIRGLEVCEQPDLELDCSDVCTECAV